MGLIEFSLKRRVTVSMFAVALVIFGFVSFTRLPINLLPDLSYPTLTVETKFAGAAPEEVETLVTRQVEELVGIVAGVRRLTSVSRPGLSQVTLEFNWGRNMDFAALDVRQKLDLASLPREAEKPLILRFDTSNDPIMRMYLTGGKNLFQLRYVAEEVLKKDLESADGVAAINVNGGYEEEIQVRVDEGKLSLLGLTMNDINQKLERENVNQAGGSLYEQEARYLVRSKNEFQNLDDILDTVLVAREGRNITMADVARIERTNKQREVITRYGGEEAVELAFYKEGDANTVSVARGIRDRIERVKKELPEGLKIVTGADQSRFIEASVQEVIKNAVMGGLIAIIVLLFFLKDVRSTLIIAITIPISIIATFFLMYQLGITLNVMSLGGLALGVGMLVDGAIVVLEAIHQRREKGERGIEAAQKGAKEVGMAVVASVLTTVVVFLPVVFVEGIAAQLFRDQAWTVSISLMASLVLSLSLIPLMSAMSDIRSAVPAGTPRAPREAREPGRLGRFGNRVMAVPVLGSSLRGTGRGAQWTWRWIKPGSILKGLRILFDRLGAFFSWALRPIGRVFDRTLAAGMRVYPGALKWSLDNRAKVLVVAFGLFLLSLLLVPILGVNLIPNFSQGEFSFSIQLPEGTPLEATDRYINQVQAALKDDTRVEAYSSTVGGAGLSLTNTGTEGENAARIQVRMKKGTGTDAEQSVIEALRSRLETSAVARYKFERPSYFTFRTPIEVEVFGDSLNSLQTTAQSLKDRMSEIPGLTDVKSSLEFGNPELQVNFDRVQLASLGLDLGEVATTVRNKVQGAVATQFLEADREIDILVRSVEAGQASIDDINNMIVGQRNGVPIFLKSVAEVKLAQGPSEVRRIGQKRAVVVGGNLSGRSMGDVAADVRSVIASHGFPAGVTAGLSGQEEEMQRSFRSLMLAGALALFLVYLVMACEFESLIHPLVVMFTVPLGAIGVIGGLALTGHAIDVVAIIGAVMLTGIVVDNAIVLIDGVNQLREQGLSRREALHQAGINRMRPILMTSACTVLGLLPMALGFGEGAELQRPLAITVIGGLTVGTFLTLLVIPVLYTLLDRKVYAADRFRAAEELQSRSTSASIGMEPDEVRT